MKISAIIWLVFVILFTLMLLACTPLDPDSDGDGAWATEVHINCVDEEACEEFTE